jgi:hypothetical protein
MNPDSRTATTATIECLACGRAILIARPPESDDLGYIPFKHIACPHCGEVQARAVVGRVVDRTRKRATG